MEEPAMKNLLFEIRYLLACFQTAALGALALTLSDWAQRVDPDGSTADIVEVLADTNDIINDMLWVESNQPTSHVSTVRTGLPAGTWRLFNYGVAQEKSRTVQVTDGMGMLETYSLVDKALADLNGNSASFRFSEDRAFIEGLNQTFASTLFYGAASEPNKFIGLAPRYNDTPQDTDDSVSTFNILDAGGESDANTSVWLICWGANTAHGIFPKGGKAGLSNRDLGEDTLKDAAGNEYQGYRTHYKWDSGIVVRDWRYVVRIANIDVDDLITFGSGSDTSANIIRLLIQAVNRLPSMGMGTPVFYCNRLVHTWLEIMASEKVNVNLTMMNYGGEQIVGFRGIPIRRCDAILNTEADVA
jgi:hypothetical protein